MDTDFVLLLLLLSLILGALLVWLFAARPANKKIAALEEQNNEFALERVQLLERSSRVNELSSLLERAELATAASVKDVSSLREQIGATRAELCSERDHVSELKIQVQKIEGEKDELTNKLSLVSIEKAAFESKSKVETEQAAEKIKLMQDAKEKLSESFELLANRILEEKSKKFTEQNSENISALLNPLRERIMEFQKKVETVYDQETRDRTALGEQVRQLINLNQSLSEEAKNLTTALKGSSKTQGAWGELVLERILEASGLRKGEEYVVQASYQNEHGGRSQPDVTVNLPEQRHLVIDSKVSLLAYDEFVSAEGNQDVKQDALKRHLESTRAHIKSLSTKNYQEIYQLQTLDFVVMFVPIESAFMLAITHDKSIFMDSWDRNVLLVSPSTLLFALRTVAHLWRQEAQNKNAQEIARRGAELYDRFCGFLADLDQVGARLSLAQESFNSAKNKLSTNRGNVIRQAEMLKDLGVKPTKMIPPNFAIGKNDNEGDENDAEEASDLN